MRFQRAGEDPTFTLQLKDKGQSGKDYAQIFKERNGWTWMRVDPTRSDQGYSRRYQTPSEIVKAISDYTKMDKDDQEALAFFQEQAKTETPEMKAMASQHKRLWNIACRVAATRIVMDES